MSTVTLSSIYTEQGLCQLKRANIVVQDYAFRHYYDEHSVYGGF